MAGVDIDFSDIKLEIFVDFVGEDGKLKSRKLEKLRSKDDFDDKKKKRRVFLFKFFFCLKFFMYLILYLYLYIVCINIIWLRFLMYRFFVSYLIGILIVFNNII